jgi:hypothetical protein
VRPQAGRLLGALFCGKAKSGSLAKFAAMRLASSLVSRLVAERRTPTVCPELMLWAASSTGM